MTLRKLTSLIQQHFKYEADKWKGILGGEDKESPKDDADAFRKLMR